VLGRVHSWTQRLDALEEIAFRWRISRIKSTPAVELGTIEAPNAEVAIQEAIMRYGITNPEHQKRLVAQRIS
jgi:hypothetical protein